VRCLPRRSQQRVCAISLASVGALLLGVGAVLTATSGYQAARGDALKRYDAVINAWNTRHAAVFNSSSWALVLDGAEVALVPGAAGGEGVLDADADAAASDSPLATQPYALERFSLRGALWDKAPSSAKADTALSASAVLAEAASALLDGETAAESEGAAAAAAAVAWAREPHTLGLVARGPAGASSPPLPLHTGPLLSRQVLPGSSWKDCYLRQRGALLGDSDDCLVWRALASLCVAVSRESTSEEWRIDTRFGQGGGCEPWGSGEAPAATFTHVPAPEVAEGDDAAAAVPTWAALRAEAPGRVEVRSAHDPALWAANATRGTYVFAQKAAARDAAGRVLVIIGGLAVITGAMLGMPAMVAAARRRGAGAPQLLADKRNRGEL